MRLGLIGLGRIGAFHADTLSTLPAVDSLVVTDFVPAVTKTVAEKVGAEAADSPESLISSGVDGIIIAAATNAHTQLIRAGVEAGIPVFCEKPLSGDIAEAAAIARYVNDSGVPVQIGYPRRFDPAFAAARAAVEAGELGWVHTVRSTTLDPAPAPRGYIEVSGGIFRDCSVHDFDTVRWVTGQEVVEVYATGSAKGDDVLRRIRRRRHRSDIADLRRRRHRGGVEHPVQPPRLRRPAGTARHRRQRRRRLERHHPAAQPRARRQLAGRPTGHLLHGPAHRGLPRRTPGFTEVVAGQRKSPCTVDDAMAVAYMAEAATLSLQQHRPVQIDEVRSDN